MSTEIIRICGGQQIYRARELPLRGKVLVRTGQAVNVGDPIAECVLPGDYLVYDIINGLKINPQKLDKHLRRLVGEKVEAGDVIAEKTGLVSRLFRAPQEGMVVSIRDGKVTLALGEKKITIFADFPGVVVELIPEKGAVIGGRYAVLQGLWGNGRSAQGVLAYLGGTDANPFDQTVIGPELSNKIVVMGYCAKEDILDACLKSQVAGIIVSGIAPRLLELVETLEIPVMSLAGFGDINLDVASESMVLKMMGRLVYLISYQADRFSGIIPEVLMPTDQNTSRATLFGDENELRVGSRVRLVGNPYTGGIGEVIDLPEGTERFPSGLFHPPVVVKRTDGEIIHIPRTNIEIILE